MDSASEVGSSGDGVPAIGVPRHALDVRPLLARGDEPFSEIMGVVDGLTEDEVLVLRTPFDPQPLHVMLGRRGFSRHTRRLASDDYETAYWRRAPADASAVSGEVETVSAGVVPRVAHVIDVRGLLPPEPLERTLSALECLPAGEALLQINERVPAFLLPELDDRGYSYGIDHDERGTLVTIWHASGS